MAKKLSYEDREKLHDAREHGLADEELKSRFGIRDDRTLKRHLKLAGQEYEARLIRLEILKDALSAHLAEIRALIEQWRSGLSTPPSSRIYFDMPHPTSGVESDPLFTCLRQHLPFPTLWRDYSMWVRKVQDYIRDCQKLMKDIGEKAEGSVSRDILNQWGIESTSKAVGLSGPLSEMMTKYRQSAESDSEIKRLLDDLKALGAKLHGSLQEVLLRRDHIMYTCKLCPGQPRLSR